MIRDALTGWWGQLDRVGREGERAFCLQAWNGDTGYTIDRIGRGTIQVEAYCMSVLGGIQPGRLRSCLADALKDGPSNDGLIQRFQLLVWPDTEPDWEHSGTPASLVGRHTWIRGPSRTSPTPGYEHHEAVRSSARADNPGCNGKGPRGKGWAQFWAHSV